jgi:hypothetical protein
LQVPTHGWGWETCKSPPEQKIKFSVTKEIEEEENQALLKVEIGPNEKSDKHLHHLQYIHEKSYINMDNIGLLKDLAKPESPCDDVVPLESPENCRR